MRDDQKTKAELGSGAGGKKPIKEAEKLRARKAKLERVSSELTKHKNADEELDKARADWEKTFDAISDWIALIDLKGRILRTNRSGEDFTSISSAQIVGQSCCKLVHSSEEYIPGCPLQKMLHSRQRERAELKVPDANRWLKVIVDPIIDKEGNLIGAVHITRDITQRKKAEEALQASEQRYRDLFENAGEGIITLDLDGRITGANKLVEEYGFNRAELNGRRLFDFVPEYDKARSVSDFQALLAGRRVQGQMDVITPKGIIAVEYRDTPIVRAGEVIGVQAILTDITERKKAEEALRQSEKKFRSIFDNANDIIASVTKTGKILEINKKIEDILGYKPDELIGKNFMTLGILAAKNAAKMFHFFKESVKLGGFLVSRDGRNVTEVWVNHKDGHTVLLEANTTTIKEDGKLVGYLSVIRDITERKRAEEAYRSLVDHSLQGLAIFQNGRVVFANQAMAEITGYTVDEMLSLPTEQVQAFVHPEDRALVWSRHRDRLDGKPLPDQYEFRGISKDGSTCWLELHANRVEYQGRPAIQAAYVDITERKQAEEASKKSKDLLEKTFSSLDSSVFVLDDQYPPVILDCNPSVAAIFGYSKKEILGRTTEFMHVSRSTLREFQEVLYPTIEERGQMSFFEFKMKRKNGDVFPSEHSVIPLKDRAGKRIGWISVVRDISERKKAEEALTESEENYHSIFDTVNDAIFIHDLKDGTILDVNEKMLEMYGFANKKEIVGSFVGKLSSAKKPYTVEDAGKWVRKAIKEGPQLFEWHAKDKKGRLFWVEVNLKKAVIGGNDRILAIVRDITKRKKTEEQIAKLAKFPAENPNPVLRISCRGTVVYANNAGANLLKTCDCRVGKSVTDRWHELVMDSLSSGQSQQTEVKCDGRIFSLTFAPVVKANYVNVYGHDITERKKAEEEIQNLNKYREQMAQAEQLASVGTLSASLAHELTQPLTVVRLSIENSLTELETVSCPDTVVEDLKEGLNGVSSIASIVNGFRNFARRTSEIKVAEVDLKAVAERIVELLDENAWRAKVTLQVEGMDKLPPIYSHEKDLERLFFSLIENAIQAADGKKSRQVIISDAVIDEHIELQFSDNCGGIAPENLDKIFEPFFTTKPAGERTGLGLCVVERIVSQLGGKVRVESKLGKGSTFFVTLPIKREER